ncbi:putative methyltransferase-domain-containing protein [Gloeopeniophorella convolvens]|nr:putative methyltransferase-domain-containing protein [Gloeopeniophorella convolvens]
MFFYVSFLRPPPLSGIALSPVVLTPQISNDLRTEPFPDSADIFYWWTARSAQGLVRLSEPAKLTTWRQENAYKSLSVAPPSPRLLGPAGTDCCLVLSPLPAVSSAIIDLRDRAVGKLPLPVSSLPIRITPRRNAAAPVRAVKQEAITRTFRLFNGDDVPLMHIKEMTSFDLDKKLWDSGIGLSAWLVRLAAQGDSVPALSPLVQTLRERLFAPNDCDIIELGAGTGTVSIVLAALRAASPSAAAHRTSILSTDLPSSMEIMGHNIQANAALFPGCAPTALQLDWDEDLPASIQASHDHAGFDIIVMADVTYNTSSFPALLRTLAALLALRPHMLVLLAYKERDPAERALWDMLRRGAGVALQRVGDEAGAGGLPVEIWAGGRLGDWSALRRR